jgi:hypothetical protein
VNSGEREAWSNERGDHNEEEGRTMSSLMVDFIISLDGYASADGWPGSWGMEGPEYIG